MATTAELESAWRAGGGHLQYETWADVRRALGEAIGMPLMGEILPGAGYDSSSESIFAGFTTPPTNARKIAIDNVVTALKAAGVWDRLDTLYAFAAADAQAATVNWISPGTFNCSAINSPPFTLNVGFAGNGTNAYVDSTFNPTTATTPHYLRNSACVFFWGYESAAATAGAAVGNSASSVVLGSRSAVDAFVGRMQNTANVVTGDSTDGSGLWSITRAGASAQEVYRNGVSQASNTGASLPLSNAPIVFLRAGPANFYDRTVSWGGAGAHLNVGEQIALYDAFAAYMVEIAQVSRPYVPETEAIAAAFTTPPSIARKNEIDILVVTLQNAGLWDKLDALWVMRAADSQAARVNWKNPSATIMTEVNAPAFAVDTGFTGNGTTSYLDTNFNLSTASSHYVQNSACAFGWSLTSGQLANGILGTGGSTVVLNGRTVSDTCTAKVNSAASGGSVASTDGSGLWAINRSAGSAQQLYKNGALVFSTTGSSAALENGNLRLLRQAATFWGGQIAFAGLSNSMSLAQQTNLYNALAAYATGIASTYEPETEAIAAAFTTPPTTARKNLINTCVAALKTTGIWAQLDCLYLLAAADAQAARVNWKNPAAFTLTEVSTPVFTADRGYNAVSGVRYLDSGYIPGTHKIAYAQNSASVHVWNRTATRADAQAMIGLTDGTNTIVINPWNAGADNAQIALHCAAANALNVGGPATGMFSMSRTAAANYTLSRNGTSLGTQTATSVALGTTSSMKILYNDVLASNREASFAAWGAGLTPTEITSFYNAIQAYMTGVGA